MICPRAWRGTLLQQFSDNIGGSIPWASQDWANTKAAYRFFSNSRISETEILDGHFEATRERIRACGALILTLHDTTEFTFHRTDAAPLGILHKSYMRKNKKGRPLPARRRNLDCAPPSGWSIWSRFSAF